MAIYTRTHDAHGKTGTGFDNFTTSSPNLPEGWSITPKQGRNDNTYGQAAPSIRLRADSASLVVAVPGNRIDSVSFWHYESTAGLVLNIDKCVDGTWSSLWQYQAEQKASQSVQLYAGEADSLRFVLTRTEGTTGGYALLDDVYLSYLFDRYTWKQTIATAETGSNAFVVADDGTTLGYTVSGLQPQDVYAYSVQARLGDRLSIVSDTIGVDTTGVIDAIRAVPFAANDVAIYDLQGRLVTTLPNGTNAAAVLPKGIYIAGGRKFVVK